MLFKCAAHALIDSLANSIFSNSIGPVSHSLNTMRNSSRCEMKQILSEVSASLVADVCIILSDITNDSQLYPPLVLVLLPY